MTFNNFISMLKTRWLTRYKLINFAIGMTALLIYEFVGRPIYRPYIYANKLNDFHIADTLGNSFGAMPTMFFLAAAFSTEKTKGRFFIILGTISVVVFELAHPLLGKAIDLYDIVATLLTGIFSYGLFNLIFGKAGEKKFQPGKDGDAAY